MENVGAELADGSIGPRVRVRDPFFVELVHVDSRRIRSAERQTLRAGRGYPSFAGAEPGRTQVLWCGGSCSTGAIFEQKKLLSGVNVAQAGYFRRKLKLLRLINTQSPNTRKATYSH